MSENNNIVFVHRLVRKDEQGRTSYRGFGSSEPHPIFPDDYIVKAAAVMLPDDLSQGEALNRAWFFTNNVSQDWTLHANVIAYVPRELGSDGHLTHRSLHGRRSSMTGDVFGFLDGRLFLVQAVGFVQIAAQESAA